MAPQMEAKDHFQTGEEDAHPSAIASKKAARQVPKWRKILPTSKSLGQTSNSEESSDELKEAKARPATSSLGILNDKETTEVPGA